MTKNDIPPSEPVLAAIVTDDAGRFAIEVQKRIQLPCKPSARDTGVSYQAQVFSRHQKGFF